MKENFKQFHPVLHKYLFTITTLSKLLAMFLFILLPFVGFYIGEKYQEKVKAIPSNNYQNITQVMPQDNSINLFEKDKERTKPEICGYYDNINASIIKGMGLTDYQKYGYRIGNGVWSYDCSRYVYNYFPPKGWGTEADISKIDDHLSGMWMYESQKSISTKLISSEFLEPARWLTYNLVTTANHSIINVDTRQLISHDSYSSDEIENVYQSINWIMYRNPKFEWQFMHPKSWKVVEENIDKETGKINNVVMFIDSLKIKIVIHSAATDSVNTKNYLNTCGLNNRLGTDYKEFCSVSLTPSHIFINENNTTLPKLITVDLEGNRYGPNNDNEMLNFILLMPTLSKFKE